MEIDLLDILIATSGQAWHAVQNYLREPAFASVVHRLFDILIICITLSQIKTIYKLELAIRYKNFQSTHCDCHVTHVHSSLTSNRNSRPRFII